MVRGFLRQSFEPASEFSIGLLFEDTCGLSVRYHGKSIKHMLYEVRVVPPGLGPFLGSRPFYMQKKRQALGNGAKE